MKPHVLALPVAISIAGAGGLLALLANRPVDYGLDNLGGSRHLVTEQMLLETAAKTNRSAPTIGANDVFGHPVRLGGKDSPRPQFVLFIKDRCPCSVDAQSIFGKLASRYAGRVDFFGVTDAEPGRARQYTNDMKVKFSVVADPRLTVIRAFEAKAALYSALVARNGHIIHMWPGYSVDLLKEMDTYLSQAAGVHIDKPFDPEFAPAEKRTGCVFGWEHT